MRNPSNAPSDDGGTARRVRRIGCWTLLVSATALLLSCQNASTVDVLQIDATGVLYGIAFVDANGNKIYDAGDRPLAKAEVILKAGTAGTVIKTDTTDSAGAYRMRDVPVGSYHLALSPSVLGDSLQSVSAAEPALSIVRSDTARVDFGVTYPTVSPAEVRDLPAGKTVITSGIALNPNVSFGDARLHIQGDSAYLRAINVARGNVQTGDSVRLEGRTAVDNGEPVLDGVTPLVLVSGARIPTPVDVSTAEAAAADSGRLDAALVRVRKAEILDTATVNGDFHFHIDDGSGVLEVVAPAFLGVGSIPPDSSVWVASALGLLVPQKDAGGSVTWQLYPRGISDLSVVFKQVDVGVGMKVAPSVAALGDTVRFKVVLTNANAALLDAVNVQVADTVPTGLALVSATPTKGRYDQATKTWTVDTLKTGEIDTLTLVTRVTTALNGTITNRAYYETPTRQVDINSSNNQAAASVQIAPKQADIGVQLGAPVTTLGVGDTLELDIHATNTGPFPATSVRIANAIPTGFVYLDQSYTRGNYSVSAGVWSIDTLYAGTTESLTLRATVAPTDTVFTVVDSAYSLGTQNVPDPDSLNNKARVTLTASPRRSVDLSLAASVDKDTVMIGDTVNIRVVLNNASTWAVTGTGAYDTLPSGLTYLQSNASSGSYNPGSGTWILDSVPALGAETLTLRAQVSTSQAATLVNRAHLRSPAPPAVDTTAANNDAQVTITVLAAGGGADLVLGPRAQPLVFDSAIALSKRTWLEF